MQDHYLTGGYLLHLICGTSYSDVDVVAKKDELNKILLDGYINDYNFEFATLYDSSWDVSRYTSKLKPGLDIIRSNDPIAHIMTFDLPFCRIACDGRKLFIADSNSIISMSANIPLFIKEQSSDLKDNQLNPKEQSSSHEPIFSDGDQLYSHISAKTHRRVLKYRGRGFTINFIDNFCADARGNAS